MRHGQLSFRVAPLAVLAAAAAAASLLGPAWSARAAPVPWLVALVAVGLPHGAADLAVSRRLCGWTDTLRLFVVYAALMAAVAGALLLAALVVLFAALSIWHFGLSHAGAVAATDGRLVLRGGGGLARGAGVLGMPLAFWPTETARVTADLFRLLGRAGAEPAAAFSPPAIRVAGVCLALTAMVALAVEAWNSRHATGCLRRSRDTLVDLLVVGLLGVAADPLLSIGLYFLCWHAWREMRPLTAVIARPADGSGPSRPIGGERPNSEQLNTGPATLLRDVAAIHVAAIPLLIPTWAALAAGWWLLSASHSPRDLAVLSVAVYLVVTPAHEALHDFLRAGHPLRPWQASTPGQRRTPPSPFRQPASSCTARSASS